MIDYLTTDHPSPGELKEIIPHLFWLRMPLPMALDHVNLWLLKNETGWDLVDTGFSTSLTRGIWTDLVGHQLEGRGIDKIIVTHFHPDHVGLAGWLCDHYQSPLYMSAQEWTFARLMSLESDEHISNGLKIYYLQAGFSETESTQLSRGGNNYAKRVTPIPFTFHRLQEGDTLQMGGEHWEVMVGTGHSLDHLCFYASHANVLIAGDHILPKISPNISIWPYMPSANPLKGYLKTLQKFKKLPKDVLVLPSHGYPFYGLHERIDELCAHHEERLESIMNLCISPQNIKQVTTHLFERELDQHQSFFAVGETIAHLNFLVDEGRLGRDFGVNGVWNFIVK